MLKRRRRDVLHLAGVQRAGQPADRRADDERPQLEPEGVDAHHFRGVLVLPDRDPRPADPAAFQVADEQQNDDDQHQAEPEPPGAVVRRHPTSSPLEKTPSGSFSLCPEPRERHLVEAARAAGDVGQVVGQQPDDLAEPQRDDRQVVAAQPQRREAEDQAGERGDGHRQRHARQPRPRGAEEPGRPDLVPRAVRAGEQRDRVGADGVEADIAEVEQAGLADHDVQADGDDRAPWRTAPWCRRS